MAQNPHAAELSKAERIDALCDQFEALWQPGQRSSLQEMLDKAPDVPRLDLFCALLAVEVELRLKARERVRTAEYEQQFPDCKEAIRSVFREIQNARSDSRSRATTLAGTVSVSGPSAETSITDSKANTHDLTAQLPASLARFQILEMLGAGAFGTVYKARDPKLARDVAIKVPKESMLKTTEDRERFLREARAAANLSHPNICPVHEVAEADGQDYIVMGFIQGKPLSSLILTGKIQARQAAFCTYKLAKAFQEAHDNGILHRDIKPANIMINRKGEPIVMDFGLARLQHPGDAQITQSGQIMGSPAYMSPEQARGASSEIGPPSDIYSLGVVLYEMLCGKRPFAGTVTEVLGQILHVPAPPPSSHKPGIDPTLEALCMKAMAKDPKDRFSSMKEFADALSGYLKGSSAMTTRANAAEATLEDDLGQETKMTEMFAALAAEQRSLTRQAVQEAAKAARPTWLMLLGTGSVIGIVVFLGIWFFARVGTVSVVIQIPIDVTNPDFKFLLNDKPIAADELQGPIELKPGDYELVVQQNGRPFRKFYFSVPKEETGPLIAKRIPIREDTVLVEVRVPMDLTDPALAFLLNNNPIGRDELKGPMELKPGDYELLVHRDQNLFKKFAFAVPQKVTGPIQAKEIPLGPGASPLDQLDGTQIAITNRFPWQPPELVAVYGDQRGTHWDTIHALALSPDGKILASASSDWTIGLWDADTLEPVGRLKMIDPGQHYSVAFTPGGQELLSGESNGLIRVWNVADRRELRKWTGHSGAVRSVVTLPDGKRALSAGDDASIRLWEIATGKELRKFDKHKKAVWKLCVTADGKRVLSGSDDKTMRFWDLETGEDLVSFTEEPAGGFGRAHRALALSPDGARAACGHSEGSKNFATMWLFDTATGKPIYRAKDDVTDYGHGMDGVHHPGSQVFSPDGKWLLSGAWSPADGNALLLWDGKAGPLKRKFAQQATGATAVVFSHDGKRIYSATRFGRIRLWDTATGQDLVPPTGHESFVSSVDIAPDGKSLLTGGEDLSVRIWNTLTGEQDIFRAAQPYLSYSAPWNAQFSPDGKTAILTGGIYTIHHARLWDRETLTELRSFQKEWKEPVFCATFSPDSQKVLAGLNGGLMLWDSGRPDEPKRLAGHVGPCSSAAFFPDGRRAVTGGEDKFVRIWDLDTGKEIQRIGPLPGATSCTVSPDGKWFAVSCRDNRSVRLYDTKSLTEHLLEGVWRPAAFSPDSKTLATANFAGTIRFWDVATRKPVRDIRLVGEIHGLDFDRTGRYLATATANGTAYLLRLEAVPHAPESNPRIWKRPAELPLPVAHWNFDEADPTKFIDISGNIPEGRAGGLRRSAGVVGKAMLLDGSEPFVALGPGNQPRMVFRSQMTLSIWARPQTDKQCEILRRNAGYKLSWSGTQFQFELVLVGAGWSQPIRVYGGKNSPDRWTHVVCVFDGDRASLYLDGHLAQSRRFSEMPWATKTLDRKGLTRPYVMFGVDPGWPNEVGGGYVGLADELMLFDTALTPEQVRILAASYQADSGVKTNAANAEFIPLFNGKDLTGWKTHPKQPGGWTVEDGLLTGRGNTPRHLFSERGDFSDFHLRAEVRINEFGNSGIVVQAPFAIGGEGTFGDDPLGR